MACAVKGKAEVLEYHFKGNRGKIREQSMMKALDLVRRLCIKSIMYFQMIKRDN